MKKLPLGIDVGMSTLDFCLLYQDQKTEKGLINNSETHILDFLKNYSPAEVFLVAEPTGTYSDKLFELAHRNGFDIRLVNPKMSSQYTQVLGFLNKTDEIAAFVLARMGRDSELTLPLFKPQSEIMKERKQLQMTLNALSKQCNMLRNQIHAVEQRLSPSEKSLNALRTSLEAVVEQEQILEQELQQLSDDEIEDFNKYATSVTGIGPKSAKLLMVYTNGLKYFDKKSQLPKFVGSIPSSHKSGSSINKRGPITKSGPSLLRACLYNAAKSGKRYNHACKALYERLRSKGKCHKVAMIAVVNKLLHQVFAVVKSKNLFDNNLYLKNNL